MYENYNMREYIKANKLAKSKYLFDKSKGLSGNIPSLDGILKNIDIVAEIPLGIKTIPLKKIVGTYFYTRSRDFASDFFPLADRESEFAGKWEAVCEHHLNEGIRDPVKIYEYLNWFYVMEGNKRVSVLKYFDAYSIEAEITRLVPKRDENDIDIKIYYEFLEFNNRTGIYEIWLSYENDFTELLKYLEEYNPELDEYANKYKHFMKNVYLPFRRTFYELDGDKLPMTTGDAFLQYTRIYGISNKFREVKRKPRLKKFLSELIMLTKENNIEIQTEPFEVQKKNVIASLTSFVNPTKKLKAAFIFEKTIDTSGWSYVHNQGRLYAEEALDGKVETVYMEDIPYDAGAYEKLRKIAEGDYDIIFTTCPEHINVTLRAALRYQDIKFFNCSPIKAFRNVSTYFGRSHEPRFLLGLIAGALTQKNIIGYIDIYNNTEVITGINAFSLGVKMVNPNAKVVVSWLKEAGDIGHAKELMYSLYKSGADIIMQNDLTAVEKRSRYFGLYSVKYDKEKDKVKPDINYASIVWDWGKFYEKLLGNIVNGNWKGIFSTESKRVNFWWGMDSGLIDIKYSRNKVPVQTQRLVELMKDMIIENRFHAFVGPIYDQDGQCKIEDGDIANYEQMLYMDWFVDNVEGEVPIVI
jgi:basic membrane lipoprotein Med (substrate-binding protein (PBP1-ABC) superfamily)